MREITSHRKPGAKEPNLNADIRVEVGDDEDKKGLNYSYNFYLKPHGEWQKVANLQFHKGPYGVQLDDSIARVNGLTEETLLAVVVDRLRRLNKANPTRGRSIALTYLEQALMWTQYEEEA